MNRYEKQLEVFKQWVANVTSKLDTDLSLKLWNGDIVPLGINAKQDMLVVINSNDAITRLIHKPKLTTIFELYYESLLDIEGGTPLDMLKRWDHIGALGIIRSMSKLELFKTFWPFVLSAKKNVSAENLAYTKSVAGKVTKGRDDQELIQFHYDLSNEFYSLFLDENMVYSCGYFKTFDTSLEQAQVDKLEMICKKLRLKEGDRFFDIGCGWGGLVCYAAQYFGVQAYGVTLSQEQFEFAQAKIKRLGLEDRVTIELRDYRSVTGSERFDKIAQIGMFEHVGFDNHDKHFEHVHTLLRPRGLYLHHAITRPATPDIKKFNKKTGYKEVVSKFIFPGGELDYIGLTVTNLERHRFEIHDVENWREHYQLTLEHWVQRLWENRELAKKEVGWSKTRLWLLSFSLFYMGFKRCTTSVFQTLASKRRIGPSDLPPTRDDLYR
jgi:cyclopropane-fatty-acyl-phospholipid synthase